jgi:hypothetical protein
MGIFSSPLFGGYVMSGSTLLGTLGVLPAILLAGASAAMGGAPPGYIDASTYGPGWNATDATACLQDAINSGQNVYVPDMGSPWNVTPITLTHSNQEIQFQSGAVVAAKKGAFHGTNDCLFTATNQTGIQLIGYGATLEMNKSDYEGSGYTPSQDRMGIKLYSDSNFKIMGLTIENTGGDGIYVGAAATGNQYCSNGLIESVKLDNNYRNGISVISAKGLTISNDVILDTSGTAPQEGIDFEPNTSAEYLTNIKVLHTIVDSNGSHGINFSTDRLNDAYDNVQATIQNVTLYDNAGDGLSIEQPLKNLTITNSLILSNQGYGAEGEADSPDPKNSVAYSAFYGNAEGLVHGWVSLGTGTLTNVQPIFYNTDPTHSYYMYLSPNVSTLISHGGSDGSYMGSRPIYEGAQAQNWAPEPGMLGFLAAGSILVVARRRNH